MFRCSAFLLFCFSGLLLFRFLPVRYNVRIMRITNCQLVDGVPMEMDGADGVTFRLLCGRDHGACTFAMRHFTVAPDGHTPQHQHNYEHEVFILAGKGIVQGGDTYRQITAGDVVLIPPNELHQFKNVGDEPMQFICLVPVQYTCTNGACEPTPGS